MGAQQQAQLDEQRTKIENYFEIRIRNALKNYFTTETFVTDASVELEEVMVPTQYERTTQEQPLLLESLPGLPILPENFTRRVDTSSDSLMPSEYSRGLQINRMDIRIMVDTSYSASDQEFISDLVRSTVDFNEIRGDQLDIIERAFPRNKRDLNALARRTPDTGPPAEEEPEEEVTPPVPDTVYVNRPDTTGQAAVDEASFGWDDPRLLWYIIGALGLALFFLLGYLVFRSKDDKEPEETRKEARAPGETDFALDEIKEELKKMNSDEEPKEKENLPTPEQKARYEQVCSYLTNQYISNPQDVADMLTEWMETDEENGALKAARAVQSANPKLLATLRPNLAKERFDTIEFMLEELDPMPFGERVETASNFKRSLIEARDSTDEDGKKESDLFNFLNQLSDSQLKHLFKDESDDMIAIALAQLSGDRAGEYLQNLDEDRRAALLIKMGKLDELPISGYKEVASYFAKKALEVNNMRYVTADGVESILALIEALPVSQQEEYIDAIAERDLDLGQKIRNSFVPFSDIPELDDELLGRALADLETDVLVYALINSEKAVLEKILETRPRREQLLIKSEIGNLTDYTSQDIEQARKKVLRAIRNSLKHSDG